MAEIKIYPTYQEFFDRIRSGKEKDYILTQRFPLGVTVCLGETPLPQNTFWDRFFYKEQRVVVCVGDSDNGRHLLAVNKKKLEESGGKLGKW